MDELAGARAVGDRGRVVGLQSTGPAGSRGSRRAPPQPGAWSRGRAALGAVLARLVARRRSLASARAVVLGFAAVVAVLAVLVGCLRRSPAPRPGKPRQGRRRGRRRCRSGRRTRRSPRRAGQRPPLARRSPPGSTSARKLPLASSDEPLVLVVDDDQVAEHGRSAAGRGLELLERRASLCWLRSWNSSARSYRRRAADVVVVGLEASPAGRRPSRRPRAAYAVLAERHGLLRRDAGDSNSSSAAVGSLGRPAASRAASAKAANMSAGLYSSTSSDGGLDDLGLADPLAGVLVQVAAAAAERQVRARSTGSPGSSSISVMPPSAGDPLRVGVEELAQLLGRLDEEVRALERGVARRAPRAGRCGPYPWSPPVRFVAGGGRVVS